MIHTHYHSSMEAGGRHESGDNLEALHVRVPIEGNDRGRWVFYLFLAFSVVIFVAPQLYIPFLQQLYIGKVLMAAAIFSYLRSGRPQGRLCVILDHRAFGLAGAIFLLAGVSVVYSMWPGGSVTYLSELVVKVMIVFFLAANVVISEDRFVKVCWGFVGFVLFNSLVGLNNYRTGNFIGFNRIVGGLAGIASNPNDLGLLLNVSLPFVWVAYVQARNFWKRASALVAIGLAVTTVVVTFSRGAFVTLMITGMVFVWHQSKGKRFQYFACAVILVVAVVPFLPDGYTERIISITDSAADETGSRDQRIRVMEKSIDSMLDHPFGVGVGVNQLSSVDKGVGWVEIHNAYLQIGVELGFLGLGLYLLLIWRVYQGLSAIEQGPVRFYANAAFALRLVILAYAVGALFSPVAYQFYFFYPAGVALGFKYMVQNASVVEDRRLPCAG